MLGVRGEADQYMLNVVPAIRIDSAIKTIVVGMSATGVRVNGKRSAAADRHFSGQRSHHI